MSKFIIEHNTETNEVIERPLTSDEIAQLKLDEIAAETKLQEAAQKAVKRQALLQRLGITEEEARLLLG